MEYGVQVTTIGSRVAFACIPTLCLRLSLPEVNADRCAWLHAQVSELAMPVTALYLVGQET